MSTAARLPRQDATANPPPALLPIFAELARHTGPIDISILDALLKRRPLTADDLGSAIKIDTGAYVRTLVYETEHVEVLVMAWLPGQRSPIHDHAGSGCAVRIVSGRALERRYDRLPGDTDNRVQFTTVRTYEPGEVACSVDADIHSLGNAAACPASPKDILVTVHVYSPPLQPTRKYQEA